MWSVNDDLIDQIITTVLLLKYFQTNYHTTSKRTALTEII